MYVLDEYSSSAYCVAFGVSSICDGARSGPSKSDMPFHLYVYCLLTTVLQQFVFVLSYRPVGHAMVD